MGQVSYFIILGLDFLGHAVGSGAAFQNLGPQKKQPGFKSRPVSYQFRKIVGKKTANKFDS